MTSVSSYYHIRLPFERYLFCILSDLHFLCSCFSFPIASSVLGMILSFSPLTLNKPPHTTNRYFGAHLFSLICKHLHCCTATKEHFRFCLSLFQLPSLVSHVINANWKTRWANLFLLDSAVWVLLWKAFLTLMLQFPSSTVSLIIPHPVTSLLSLFCLYLLATVTWPLVVACRSRLSTSWLPPVVTLCTLSV